MPNIVLIIKSKYQTAMTGKVRTKIHNKITSKTKTITKKSPVMFLFCTVSCTLNIANFRKYNKEYRDTIESINVMAQR